MSKRYFYIVLATQILLLGTYIALYLKVRETQKPSQIIINNNRINESRELQDSIKFEFEQKVRNADTMDIDSLINLLSNHGFK